MCSAPAGIYSKIGVNLKDKSISPELPFLYRELLFHVRADFLKYLESIAYNERTVKKVVSFLDRYVSVIRQPLDIIELFSRVKRSRRHLILALRKLFSFYEALGYDKGFLDSLRAALPKVHCGIDLKIPEEVKIVESLRKLPKAPLKYQALYNLLLDSGLRLIEACELINNFKEAEAVNGFYRCELAMFRGRKTSLLRSLLRAHASVNQTSERQTQ